MKVRFALQHEIDRWNDIIISNPDGGNFNQSSQLAKVKSQYGWKIRYIVTENCAFTVHERFIFGLGKLWYIPKGPGVCTIRELKSLIDPLRKFAHKNGVFVIKIEPEIIKNDKNVLEISNLGLKEALQIQANSSTVILDISKRIDEIMADLPQKSRNAIRRSQRDGIEIKNTEPNNENLNTMLSLMKETMAGKNVRVRDSSYYKKFWKFFSESGIGFLFIAYHNSVPVAGAFVLKYGNKATYKDGGSIRNKTIYGASHALQWHIIEWLKKQNVNTYDLCGTPPSDEIYNKSHPYYGIGLFKTSFKKTVTDFIGVYDIIVNPISYKLWKLFGERIIYRYFSKVLRKFFY